MNAKDRRPRFRHALGAAGFLCALPLSVIPTPPDDALSALGLWAFATLIFGLMAQGFAQHSYSDGFKDGAAFGSANPNYNKAGEASD